MHIFTDKYENIWYNLNRKSVIILYMDLVDSAIKSINTKTNLNLVRKGKKIILGKSN